MITKLKSILPDNLLDLLNGVTFFISIWFFILPYPSFTVLFCVIATIPIVGVLLTIYNGNASFNGYIAEAFNEDQQTISLHIKLASFVLAFAIYRNFDCENYYSLFKYIGLAFIFFGVLFFLAHRKIKGTTKQQMLLYGELFMCVLLYSYAVIFGANCLFDTYPSERFRTNIIDKYTQGGGEYPSTYYFTVASWGHHHHRENISVSEEQYDAYDTNYDIYIDQQKGSLNIPWYHISSTK